MAMPINVDVAQFKNLVLRHYKFLSDDYGFSISQKDDFVYEAETSNAKIRIFIEYSTLVTDMEPAGESANELLRRNLIPKRMGITTICEYLDPGFHYEVEMLDNRNLVHNIPVELERRAILLKKYCGKLLQGDFSVWPDLMAYLTDKRKRR